MYFIFLLDYKYAMIFTIYYYFFFCTFDLQLLESPPQTFIKFVIILMIRIFNHTSSECVSTFHRIKIINYNSVKIHKRRIFYILKCFVHL